MTMKSLKCFLSLDLVNLKIVDIAIVKVAVDVLMLRLFFFLQEEVNTAICCFVAFFRLEFIN